MKIRHVVFSHYEKLRWYFIDTSTKKDVIESQIYLTLNGISYGNNDIEYIICNNPICNRCIDWCICNPLYI